MIILLTKLFSMKRENNYLIVISLVVIFLLVFFTFENFCATIATPTIIFRPVVHQPNYLVFYCCHDI